MQGKECVYVCVYVCVPMEEHEAWTMRHSCNLPRGRTGRFKESCIEILFFFFFWPRLEGRANGSSISIHSGL